MKSNYFKSGLIAIFVIAFCVAQAATYHSTTAGGNWHLTTTWQEGIVPTATDDVAITEPGTVIIYNSGHECNNLTVESGATLCNSNNLNRTLIVNGNIINNGTITDPNYSLTLNITGDITNNGVWSNRYTNLTGTGAHTLSQGPGAEFSGTNFTAVASTGNITAISDLLFDGTNIDLNGDTLIMPAVTGSLLRLTGGRIEDGNIQANGGNLIMYSGAYIGANLIITDLYSINGTIPLNGTGIEFSGNIINFGVLQNYNNVNASLNINGNIINNGTITDPNYSLTLHITGNITNNGVWSNRYTNLTGTGTHILSQGTGAEFSGTNFTAVTSTGNITSTSDLSFNGTNVDLNGDTLYMATTGSLLSFTAGRIEDGKIQAYDGNLFMQSGAYIGSNFTITDITLEGIVQLNGTGIEFIGEIINNAFLRNSSGVQSSATITGNVTNNDTITNYSSTYKLSLNVTGDITNNGLWANYYTGLTGTGTRTISQGTNAKFSGSSFIVSASAGNITSLSDLTFEGTNIDLNGDSLIMPATKGSVISLTGGRIGDGYLQTNDGNIFMENGAYIYSNLHITDVTLGGTVELNGTGIEFIGEIINNAFLRNSSGVQSSATITGNVTNNDTITNYSSTYKLSLNVTGDITNNGLWANYYTGLTGTGTRTISQGTNAKFSGSSFIVSASAGNITSLSDLTFEGTNIDLNGDSLIMPATKGSVISLTGGRIGDGYLQTNDGNIFMENGAYIYSNLHITDVTLGGTVELNGTGIEFIGEIINNAFLRNSSGVQSSATITGNVTNNDTITNYSSTYKLSLNVTGDITNNGLWANYYTGLTGTGTRTISQGTNAKFSGSSFIVSASAGNITSLSDLTFEGTNIDLNGDSLIMPATKGSVISLTGGRIGDGYLQTNDGNIFMENGAYIYSNLHITDVTLGGTVELNGTGIEFIGEIINNAFLRNSSGVQSSATITGNVTNNDTITNYNSTYRLTLNVTGDITNNGLWANYYTGLTGTGTRTISQGTNAKFSGSSFIVSASSGNITSLSDLTFEGTNIDLNGDSLIMPSTKGSVINLTGGRIGDGYLQTNDGNIFMENGAFIYTNLHITDVTLGGTVELNGTGIEFIGEIINNAFLRNSSGVQSSATITGNVTNNDTITNYNSTYRLTLNVTGDITNNGEWSNYSTTLNGVDDQLIYLIGGQEMTGQFRFNAMINDPPYQWKWNGDNLNSSDFTGETSNSLVWQVPVSDDYIGEFICYGSSATSRTITIRSGIIIDPVVQLQGPYNVTNMNTDLTAQGLIPVGQPFNVAPWNYSGDETLNLIPPDIVDWILVEFRETAGGPEDATSDSIVFRRALMLQNDGRVIDPISLKPELKCDIDFEDNIYLVIWHRNHLGVLSAVPISGGNTPAYYDFSESASQAFGGTDALVDLGNGVYGMMTGDANADGYIGTQDKSLWENQAGSQAYVSADFNMDSQVNNPDKNDYWYPNIGESCQVPISFTCGNNFIDYRDGQTYSTVQIGSQCWMAENLNIGTMINGINEQTDNSTIEKYCYNDNTSNCDTYGGLYQWNEIMEYTTTPGIQGICPADWHIPTDEELKQLEGEVDSYYNYPDPEWDGTGSRGTDAGSNLKSTSGWSGSGNGTDLYGFTLLPGGKRYTNTSFGMLVEGSYLWSSSQFDGMESWSRSMHYMFNTVNRYSSLMENGYSVRCLRDY